MQIFCVIEDARAKNKKKISSLDVVFVKKKLRRPLFRKFRCLLIWQKWESSVSLSETVIKALVRGSNALAAAQLWKENCFIIYGDKILCLVLSNQIMKSVSRGYRQQNTTFSYIFRCFCSILLNFFLHFFWQHVFHPINFEFYCSNLVLVSSLSIHLQLLFLSLMWYDAFFFFSTTATFQYGNLFNPCFWNFKILWCCRHKW